MEKCEQKINENRDIKIYVEKHIFDQIINEFNERQNKIKNDYENDLKHINSQIDSINKSINQFKLDKNNDMNRINGFNDNINSLKSEIGTITEDISQLKYQITPDLISNIKSINFNNLKEQISPYEFKSLKDNINNYETNLNSLKTMAENNDKSIYDIKKQINNIESSQNLSNKTIENMQPLLNENILDKIKTINKKIEELSKSGINNPSDNNNNNENKKDIEEKKEENELFIGGSRRQQRATKSVNNNNINKNNNANLDEKTLNLIKKLENINLNELEKIDFKNILSQINDLSKKINEQNNEISKINEKLNTLKSNSNNNNVLPEKNIFEKNSYNYRRPDISDDFKTNGFEINDPYSRNNKTNTKGKDKDKDIINKKENKDIFEEKYNDFDKDFDDKKNEKDKKTKININDDEKNNKYDLLKDNKFSNDMFNKNKSKNEFGSFDKYSEINILDQIMGIGGSRRNNDFDKKLGTGGSFMTGSLNGNNKNNNYKLNDNDKLPIFNDDNKNKIKNNEIKDKKENKIEEKVKDEEKENKKDDCDEYNDDFDDFDDELN